MPRRGTREAAPGPPHPAREGSLGWSPAPAVARPHDRRRSRPRPARPGSASKSSSSAGCAASASITGCSVRCQDPRGLKPSARAVAESADPSRPTRSSSTRSTDRAATASRASRDLPIPAGPRMVTIRAPSSSTDSSPCSSRRRPTNLSAATTSIGVLASVLRLIHQDRLGAEVARGRVDEGQILRDRGLRVGG